MYQTITKSDFRDAFVAMDRQNQFSYDGLGVLYDFLEDNEYGELDVIGLCCDFAEYNSLRSFQQDYGDEYKNMGDIRDMTVVLDIPDGGFIIEVF